MPSALTVCDSSHLSASSVLHLVWESFLVERKQNGMEASSFSRHLPHNALPVSRLLGGPKIQGSGCLHTWQYELKYMFHFKIWLITSFVYLFISVWEDHESPCDQISAPFCILHVVSNHSPGRINFHGDLPSRFLLPITKLPAQLSAHGLGSWYVTVLLFLQYNAC